MSGSMSASLPLLRAGAVQLFTDLLPADKARVGSFADRIIVSSQFTNDVDDLIHSLYLDLPQSGNTPLWGAVNVAMTALSRLDGRRVVLVFTDGHDTARKPSLKEVMLRSQSEEFMVYGIGLNGRSPYGFSQPEPPDPGLQLIATESGGGYFELTNADDLGATFKRVADELHRQYLIGFQTTATDGKMHDLEVRVRRPSVTVRARKSYKAPGIK
jgi:Ca-activated chloride channel family protein